MRLMQRYSEFLLDKRVVLIGPAPSIVGSGQCQAIEDYDVVVRMNHALPVPAASQQDVGKRTDILYSTVKIPKSLHPNLQFVKKTVEWLVCPYGPVDPFDRYMKNFESKNKDVGIRFLRAYNGEEHLAVEREIGTRPTIALAAIIHLLRFGISELYITGITFYKKTTGNEGGYCEAYKNKDDYGAAQATEKRVMALVNRIGVHDMEKHIIHMRKLMSDDRLRCDMALREVLEV